MLGVNNSYIHNNKVVTKHDLDCAVTERKY